MTDDLSKLEARITALENAVRGLQHAIKAFGTLAESPVFLSVGEQLLPTKTAQPALTAPVATPEPIPAETSLSEFGGHYDAPPVKAKTDARITDELPIGLVFEDAKPVTARVTAERTFSNDIELS
jgi:hypothetical protein